MKAALKAELMRRSDELTTAANEIRALVAAEPSEGVARMPPATSLLNDKGEWTLQGGVVLLNGFPYKVSKGVEEVVMVDQAIYQRVRNRWWVDAGDDWKESPAPPLK
jgi:hypothetical protein